MIMKIEELFIVASQEKYRFSTSSGQLMTENLWELPLTSNTKVSLDSLAIDLSRELKGSSESFVNKTTKNKTLENKLEIVKYVIQCRLEMKQLIDDQRKRKSQAESISKLIEEKEQEDLRSLSIEELKKLQETL